MLEEAEALCLLGEEHFAEVAVAETDLAVFGDGAWGMQKDWRPMPIAAAASAALTAPLFIAIAQPTVYAQIAFSKQMGWVPLTILSQSMPFARVISLHSSMEEMPY